MHESEKNLLGWLTPNLGSFSLGLVRAINKWAAHVELRELDDIEREADEAIEAIETELAKPKERKVVQICVSTIEGIEDALYALCDDGGIFRLAYSHASFLEGAWEKLPKIPQEKGD